MRVFSEHHFYVGLSIDGPKDLHDAFRKGKGGAPTFDQVYRAAKLLRQYQIPFNPLVVVNSVNARHPAEVYQFLTEDLGCSRIQWLPCADPKDYRTTAPGHWDATRMPIQGTPASRPGHPDSVVTDWSVYPDDWGEFLCRTFDLWLKTGLGRVLVNWFETSVGAWMNEPAQMCNLAPVCGRSLVALERTAASTVNDVCRNTAWQFTGSQLADVVYSPRQRQFGLNKRNSRLNSAGEAATSCLPRRVPCRFIKSLDGQPGHNYSAPA